MTPQEWERVKELLEEALEHRGEARAALLETVRHNEPSVVQEVERLLEVDDDMGDFIEEPAFDIHDRDDPAVRVGQMLGPWRLVRELGSGGMGAVYLAVRDDDEFEQTVAVKVLKRGLDTEEVIHRFRTERQILAGLDHPNIARLYDGGTTPDGRPYLVMERVEGRPVDVYCHDEGLDVDESLDLFLTVCDAVQLAHRNLVVHRDLKPSNILITEDGVPKLLDFGIARLLSPERGHALPTVGAWRFLTPEYASPEQLTGQPVTTASDVYSLGVLLHLLLTDHRPFDPEERSAAGMLRALEAGEPPRPSSVAPAERRKRLRGDLDNILLTALRREPERRYGTVDQLADELRSFLTGLPVRATPDSWRYRAQKFVRRHRVAVTAATAIAVLLVGFSVVTAVLMRQAETEKDRAERMIAMMQDVLAQASPDAEEGGEVSLLDAIDKTWKELAQADDDELVRADLLENIGKTQFKWRLWEEALALFKSCLRLRLKIKGGDDPLVAGSLSSIAQVYYELGETRLSQLLLLQAITIERAHRSALAPEMLSLMNNLAVTLRIDHRFDEAEYLLREIIREREKASPEGSKEVAYNYHNLGNLLLEERRFGEAEACFRKAVALRTTFGEEATGIGKSRNGLATSLQAQGRIDDAEKEFQETAAFLRATTKEHPQLALTKNNLGLLLFEKGDLDGAEANLREAVSILADRPSPVLWINLASVLLAQGEVDEAEARLADVSSMTSRMDSWRYEEMQSMEGAILADRGRFQEAEPLLVESCQRMIQDLGREKFNSQVALGRLIHLYEAWGKPTEAMHWQDVLDGRVSALPPELPQPERPST